MLEAIRGELNFYSLSSNGGGNLCDRAWERGIARQRRQSLYTLSHSQKQALGLWPTSGSAGLELLVSNAAIMVAVLPSFILAVTAITLMSEILHWVYWAHINLDCLGTLLKSIPVLDLLWRSFSRERLAHWKDQPLFTSVHLLLRIASSLFPSCHWCETDKAWSTATHCQVLANGINSADG